MASLTSQVSRWLSGIQSVPELGRSPRAQDDFRRGFRGPLTKIRGRFISTTLRLDLINRINITQNETYMSPKLTSLSGDRVGGVHRWVRVADETAAMLRYDWRIYSLFVVIVSSDAPIAPLWVSKPHYRRLDL